jgi:hypothetical protein
MTGGAGGRQRHFQPGEKKDREMRQKVQVFLSVLIEHDLTHQGVCDVWRRAKNAVDTAGRRMKTILAWWWQKRMARMIRLRLALYRHG